MFAHGARKQPQEFIVWCHEKERARNGPSGRGVGTCQSSHYRSAPALTSGREPHPSSTGLSKGAKMFRTGSLRSCQAGTGSRSVLRFACISGAPSRFKFPRTQKGSCWILARARVRGGRGVSESGGGQLGTWRPDAQLAQLWSTIRPKSRQSGREGTDSGSR